MKPMLLLTVTLLLTLLTRLQPAPALTAVFNESTPAALPLLFSPEPDSLAAYSAVGLGGRLVFQPAGVTLTLPESEGVAVRYLDANPATTLTPLEQQPGVINRYLGSDPAQWQSGIATYAALTYEALYPGIDLRYDGVDGRLKGTFTVAPGSDPGLIRWRYDGARAVAVDSATGDLQIELIDGRILTESAPVAWQVINGQQHPVAVRFVLNGRDASFALGPYDPHQPLIIDPTLTYGTFLGGISSDFIHDIGLDSAGNVYVAGWTYSNNLGGFPNAIDDYNDAFVAKLNAAGTAWQWVTYLGGGEHEYAYGLAVGSGAVWLTGSTDSDNYPTTSGAYQNSFGGFYDLILTRLNPANGTMTYSTYYGYDNLDEGRDVALDASGNVYVTGQLNQSEVLALKMTGGTNPAMVYHVQWGDDYGEDKGYGIAVNSAGQVYITGMTAGAPSGVSTFPTYSAVQSTCGPYVYTPSSKSCTTDAFVSILNSAGNALVFSTLLGGSGSPSAGSGADEGRGIALDAQGNIYVTGLTYAADFPTVNAAYGNYPDPTNKADAWVTKFAPNGQSILYSTYLGADDDDQAKSIVADNNGNAYVLGITRSTNFPTLNAMQNSLGTGGVCYIGSTVRYCYDSFITKLAANGSVLWSSYLGGAWDEYGHGLARDGSGALYVAGITDSPNYPTTNGAPQRTLAGNEDGFITRIADNSNGGGGEQPGSYKVYIPFVIK